MKRLAQLAALTLPTLLLLASTELAAEPRLERFESDTDADLDAPAKPTIPITDLLTLGADVTLDFESERDFDLDGDVDDDRTTLQPELNVTLSFDPDEQVQVFVESELSKNYSLDTPKGEGDEDLVLEIQQAFLYFSDIYDVLSLQLGRQEFEDEREWIYDEDLDAVRAYVEHESWTVELSVSQEELLRKDLLNDIPVEDVNNYVLLVNHERDEDAETAAYVIYRDQRESREGEQEDLLFFGLQSGGEVVSDLSYWANLSHVRSTKAPVDVRGFGGDMGLTYVFDAPLEPSVTLGAAFGTGDRDGGNGTDRAFRQTGLHDNEAAFNGVTSFSYYGVTFDPELSNLGIATAGLGVRPTDDTSIDVIYHFYRQHRVADEIRDTAIDADPDGRHRTLGNELDVVLGLREFGNFDAELVFGVFWPGAAFPDKADNAYFGGIEVVYTF
jgi:alginate production protein